MAFLNNIKSKIGNSVLQNKAKQNNRKRGIFNFETAKTVGIILYTRNNTFFEAAQDFVKFLKNESIDTWSIGYADSNEVINAYAYQIGMNHFTKKNLNWFNKPKGSHVEQFISKEFDILIDLTMVDFFPVQYIVGLSKAKFKIGKFNREDSYYDLMINIKDNSDIKYFISQIIHYLYLIKN